MSFQGWATYPSLSSRYSRDGSFLQGLAKGPSFLGRQQGRRRARSMEMPRGHSKGPLRAFGFLDSGQPSCLKCSHSPRSLDRPQSPNLLRGIHSPESSTSSYAPTGKDSNPFINRRASLPHLLDWTSSGVNNRALILQGWKSEQGLQSSLLESVQQPVELVGCHQTVQGTLREQAQEIQRQEKALELSQMKCELLDLRQKMESSLVRLEWERKELEKSRRQEQQQDRELHNKILHLQAEVMKAKLCLDRMSQRPLFVEDPKKSRLRLEGQRADTNAKLQTLLTDQDSILQGKPRLDDRGWELSSNAKDTLEGQEEGLLRGPKTSTLQELQDMILLQEELVIIKEVNEQLSLELGQSRQQLRTCLDQLYQLQEEKKISHSWLQVLETERVQLVGENLVLLSVLQEQQGSSELRPASWKNSETSGQPQQKELTTPQQESEEERWCPKTHEEVVQYWKARWYQVANELRSKEEELEMIQRQRKGWSCKIPWVQELLAGEEENPTELKELMGRAKETSEVKGTQLMKMFQHLSSGEDSSFLTEKMESQRDLQRKIKILEQENAQMALVIQRWKCQSEAEPQRPLQEQQGSSSGSPQVPEMLQPFQRDAQGGQEAGAPGPLSEVEILRQELQKERTLGQEREQRLQSLTSEVQDLKQRKPEEHKASLLIAQDSGQQGLETAENQLRKENQRLELLVSSLQQKLEEKEQTLKELRIPRASEQGETGMTPSSLLKKLPLHSPGAFSQVAPEELKRGPRAGWEGVPQGHCTHCNAFLEQLDKVLQGWEASSKPTEEKPQVLEQLQKVLEGPNKQAPKGGRAPRSDLRDMERVKQQHRLVTEQLQDLFGERRERTGRTGQPPREWPEGSSGDQGTKKPQ
ncbi:uncharacterized protein LOC141520833 isoform X2 [Macrotis lagotis]|uniref:uncharacterized protein LOC141520833 isoform X2 n=1 Tax=Macrotis lagotis TaxID=92651 RepID=UPI003D69F35E